MAALGFKRRLTDMHFYCATKMPNASAVREPDAYRDSIKCLLESEPPERDRHL